MGVGVTGRNIRQAPKVSFSGVQDSVCYTIPNASPFVHRRLVFETGVQLTNEPSDLHPAIKKDGAAAKSLVWPGTAPVTLEDGTQQRRPVGSVSDIPVAIWELLFSKNTVAQRLWDSTSAKLNDKVVRVLFDECMERNVVGAGGELRRSRYWNPVKKVITYGDEGGVVGGSEWAAETSACGNIYVLDIFYNLEQDSDVNPVEVYSEMVVNWQE